MALNNTTLHSNVINSSVRIINEQVLIVQVLVMVFLYINSLLIFAFFKKETFYTNTRYIFFAHTLICDCVFLFMSDLLLVMSYFQIPMPAGLCVIICVVMIILTFATPLTLTAMSVERYVAICMPLRHAEISTPHRALYGILVIHAFSKKSTSKCLKTVILHGFQLVLSLFQLWCPFIEMAVLQIGNLELFVTIRYLNYLAFILAPKCLNPLIYGLRDDQFYLVLKNYAFCGLINRISPVFTEK
uniref:G-protein coupled receptors family 1 profile domain-containing protein n=1 Tax=Paramormyrops kingsleyae TaxID=1676925 RepID=A0A3B3QTM6_9TELE